MKFFKQHPAVILALAGVAIILIGQAIWTDRENNPVSSLGSVLVLTAIGIAIWKHYKHKPAKTEQTPAAPMPATTTSPNLDGNKEFILPGANKRTEYEVVGEYYRQDAVLAALRKTPRPGRPAKSGRLDAYLIPEPDNAHDPNAVMVMIRGIHVGYLPAEDAFFYCEPFTRLVNAGLTPMTTGQIWAAVEPRRGGDKLRAEVYLALTVTPEELSHALDKMGLPR